MGGGERQKLLFAYSDSEADLRAKLTEAREKYSGQNKSPSSSCYVDGPDSSNSSDGRLYRGYTLVDSTDNVVEVRKSVGRRPIYYCMTGNGCQWHTMGRQLMHIPLFRKTITRCHKVLEPYGYDLLKKLMEADKEWTNQGQDYFMGITAIQIALVDILKAVGAPPDGIFGHSFGEYVCPYPDGCFTLEENMLSTFHLVRCVDKVTRPLGTMAVVAADWDTCGRFCNKDVQRCCNNSPTSVTIAGKTEAVTKLIKECRSNGIRAMAILKSPTPHNELSIEFLEEMQLATSLAGVVPERPRSKKWLSTSYPQDKWDTEEAQTWGPRYMEYNFRNNVLFYDVVRTVPKDSLVIEVAPTQLFRRAVTDTIGPDSVYVSLMRKEDADGHRFLMDALGTIFVSGIDIKPEAIFLED